MHLETRSFASAHSVESWVGPHRCGCEGEVRGLKTNKKKEATYSSTQCSAEIVHCHSSIDEGSVFLGHDDV